jgi:DNA repair photolyase
MAAPVIPALTDHELDAILSACAQAGASSAGYVLVRLPHEVKDLFKEWLTVHKPDRASHVMNLIRGARAGKENDPAFGTRMRGSGEYADLLRRRFQLARTRLGLDRDNGELDISLFRAPRAQADPQLSLL